MAVLTLGGRGRGDDALPRWRHVQSYRRHKSRWHGGGAVPRVLCGFHDVPQTDQATTTSIRFPGRGDRGLQRRVLLPHPDVNRAQMAVFMLRGLLGNRYYPPPASDTMSRTCRRTVSPRPGSGPRRARDHGGMRRRRLLSVAIHPAVGMAVFLLKTLLGIRISLRRRRAPSSRTCPRTRSPRFHRGSRDARHQRRLPRKPAPILSDKLDESRADGDLPGQDVRAALNRARLRLLLD